MSIVIFSNNINKIKTDSTRQELRGSGPDSLLVFNRATVDSLSATDIILRLPSPASLPPTGITQNPNAPKKTPKYPKPGSPPPPIREK